MVVTRASVQVRVGDASATRVPAMPILTPRRGSKPVKRPPHIVSRQSSPSPVACNSVLDNNSEVSVGIAPAPLLPEVLDDVDSPLRAPSTNLNPCSPSPDVIDYRSTPDVWPSRPSSRASPSIYHDGRRSASGYRPRPSSSAEARPFSSADVDCDACLGGRAHRPDTCFLTHTYMKQEMAYLSRRVDEVARYFVALEQMLGTGTLGPLLEKSYKELESRMQTIHEVNDIDEVQGLIDAAVRLGLSPKRYAPLRERLAWLESGIKRESLLRDLDDLKGATDHPSTGDPGTLQQLIDDAVRHGISAKEINIARKRLKDVQQAQIDEVMLSAASSNDVIKIEMALRAGANCDAQQAQGGASLWHLAAVLPDNTDSLIDMLRQVKACPHLLNSQGHTPMITAAACQNSKVVKHLIEIKADVDTRTEFSEELLDCSDEVVDVAFKRMNIEDDLLLSTLNINGIHLDVGDRLASTDLQLLVFQRIAGRAPLHFAVMRGARDGKEVAVIKTLVENDADINACDELGRTPLWYAAQAGCVAGLRTLLHYDASIIVRGNVSPLVASARSYAMVMESGENKSAANGHKEVLRVLMRHGASRGLNQVHDAVVAFAGHGGIEARAAFLTACQSAEDLAHALAFAGGSPEDHEMIDFKKDIVALREKYANLLPFNRFASNASLTDAVAGMASVMQKFKDLTFDLARITGARALIGSIPSATALTRLARKTGLLESHAEQSESPWFQVTGGVHCTLVCQDIPSLAEALKQIEEACCHHIRGVENYLFGEGSQHSMFGSMKRLAWVRRPGAIVLSLEIDGIMCCLRVTITHHLEVEEDFLHECLWLLDEVATAFGNKSKDELLEAISFAAENLSESRISAILDSPFVRLHEKVKRAGSEMTFHDSPLCTAIKTGFSGALNSLLDASVCPNASSENGTCALSLAASHSDLQSFACLICAGADPSTVSLSEVPEGAFRFLLGKAIHQHSVNEAALAEYVLGYKDYDSNLREVQRLLKAGCSANGKAASGQALLSCAVEHRSLRLVRLLLKHGARVQNTGSPPKSALSLARGSSLETLISHRALKELQIAVSEGDVAGVHALLEVGLDPESMVCGDDKPRFEAQTLLEYAVSLPEEHAVPLLHDLLERNVCLERHDGAGQTVLISVVRSQGSVKIIETLLSHHADPLAVDTDGRTAAMHAAGTGQNDALAALLHFHASTSAEEHVGSICDCNGKDVMMHALVALQSTAVQLLLDHGYKMDRMAVLTELFSTCRRGHEEQRLIQLLDIIVKVFPGIAVTSEDGEENVEILQRPNLLMESVKANSPNAVKALLNYGAQIHPCLVGSSQSDDQDNQGDSAWSLANGNSVLQTLLREALPTEFLLLANQGNSVATSNLQAEEARGLPFDKDTFSVADAEGFGVVDHAAMQGLEELEAWCIEREGCFLSLQTRSVALFEPVKSGNFDSVRRRVQAGADVSALDPSGQSVLDWCLIASGLDGYVWHCVEAALTSIFSDEDDRDPLEVATSVHGGSTPSRRSLARSLSFGGASDENDRPLLKSRGDRASTVGSMAGRSISASSSAGRMARRRKAEPTPDPRHAHAVVEEFLIKAGARYSQAMSRGWFCLWEPFLRRDLDAVRRRITAGGDCTIANEKGTTLPHCALDVANQSLAILLVECSAHPDSRDHRGKTLLWRAVEMKHNDLINTCLRSGANVSLGLGTSNSGSGDGSLAHLALETTQPDLALRFLEGGCSPNKVESHGRTVLWRAVELGHMDVAEACLRHGGDMSVVDPFSNKGIVHLALERKMGALVSELIKAKAPLDVVDRQGQTPLMLAAKMGETATVDMLLEQGARPGVLGGREAIAALKGDQLDIAVKLIQVAGPASFDHFDPHAKDSDMHCFVDILGHCWQLDALSASIACMIGALQGVGFSTADAEKLSTELCEWGLKKNPPAVKQVRLDALQALPRSVIEDGSESAAKTLLDAGVQEETVERLARALTRLPKREQVSATEDTTLVSMHDDTTPVSKHDVVEQAKPTARSEVNAEQDGGESVYSEEDFEDDD